MRNQSIRSPFSLFFQVILLLCLSSFGVSAQQKIFFDKVGKATDEGSSYYYRTRTGEADGYKSFYTNGGSVYFTGKIANASDADESLNIYSGTCNWFFKNGNPKFVRTFDKAGVETGTSSWYYESGKLWKEVEFAGGKAKSTYKEFDEDGRTSRIFEESFKDNSNDWDLYNSDKTSADLRFGTFQLTSYTSAGASRYISHPIESSEFAVEAVLNMAKMKDGEKGGLIFGFKDWQNYNFFLITNSSFYIGSVYEGISSIRADGMFSGDILKSGQNNIKVISNGEKNIYSINGSIQYSTDRSRNPGANMGFAVSGKSTLIAEKLIVKEIDFKGAGFTKQTEADADVKATGSGLVISSSGYVLTNYHVIKTANKIVLQMNEGGVLKNYNAVVIQKDQDNDLAILQIKDESFKPFAPLKYAFKETGGVEVGASVFTIGYPHALTGMGIEAKFTDGKVSSKTGFNNAINTYQVTVPLQPGNSGGPLFTEKGELIGVVNSSIRNAENVSYAIKLNYVKNLIELLPETMELPKDVSLASSPLEDKIKVLSQYVTLIKIK
ncbi:MAG: trypsin-like peptidase domain-containing protein [Bacteroidia bacterium]